jgi:hypothetical protein
MLPLFPTLPLPPPVIAKADLLEALASAIEARSLFIGGATSEEETTLENCDAIAASTRTEARPVPPALKKASADVADGLFGHVTLIETLGNASAPML